MRAWTAAAPWRSKRTRKARPTRPRCCGWKSMSIRYELTGSIARITLDRPEKRNALDKMMIGGLVHSLGRSMLDENVRVVLIAGAEPDFCAGMDLKMLRETSDTGVMRMLESAGGL